MYDDDYDKNDSKRLSYISSPRGESITTIPPSLAGSASPTSPQSLQLQSRLSEVNHHQPDDGEDHQRPPPLTSPKPLEQRNSSSPSSPGSPGSPGSSKTDTATTSFPLNDVDYESNPAAVAQELNNLAAIRRMSMDVAATGDPDLPDFASSVSSIAPAPSADENDASRLFWVPARLHPELAPGEFKSFLDNRSDRIKRRSTEFSSLSPEGPDSAGGLRRKRSMLSREIDSSHGYTDGAERLERKRSESSDKSLSPNLQELESMVDDSKKSNNRDPASVLDSMQTLVLAEGEDKPILPPTPRAPGLRRSTRTQYRKAGSVKNGERPTYPKRLPQSSSSESNQSVPSIVTSSADQPILGLTRVSTDPTPSAKRAPLTKTAQQQQQQQQQSTRHSETAAEDYSSESRRTSSDHEESRRGSNERPNSDPKLPSIVETPPVDNRSQKKPSGHGPDQTQKRSSPIQQQQQQQQDNGSSKRSGHSRGKDTNLNDFANNPQLIPGNSTRTDSLSFIPTFSEDHSKKTESKKSKDRKDSEGGSRKSSWHWLLGTEEKDKDKEKKREKDKDGDASKKIKAKLVEKVHDTTNHNLNHNNHASASSPSSSTSSAAAAAAAAVAGTTNGTSDSSPRGRESIVIDRLDPKLEEERKKDSNNRRTSSETKKEKESGLFSSLFGGGRKKHGDGHHKKSLSRTLSPDPPVRILRPDLDYPWTRFSILEERAIYRMAHIKLANPRRALHSQVLLSNFMYSYLAKVQQMQPQMVLATSAAQRHQRAREKQEEEYQQYQRYQEEVSVI